MKRLIVITAVCAVLAFGQLPKPGGTTGGAGGAAPSGGAVGVIKVPVQ